MIRRMLIVLALFISGLLITLPVGADCSLGTTFTVTDQAGLNSAIVAYNGCTDGGDVVTVTVSGTIALTNILTLTSINNGNGARLIINGGGTAIIDGDYNAIFDIVNGHVTLNGLRMLNGSNGGGIGGIIRNNGTLYVNNSTFEGGNSEAGGGAIGNEATAVITGSTFLNNRGSAIYSRYNNSTPSIIPNLTIINSIFRGNNTDGNGGAILNNGGDLDRQREHLQ
jgi:hypothetical protein